MKLKLHHINLSTTNVEAMDSFYQDVLGLERETQGLPVLEKTKGYAGDVAFVSDGDIQMHLATRDIEAGFRTGLIVNPVARAISPIAVTILPPSRRISTRRAFPIPTGVNAPSMAGTRSSSTTPTAMSSRSIRSRSRRPRRQPVAGSRGG